MSDVAGPRILPLPEGEWDETVRDVVAAASVGANNLATTLGNHPKLFRDWLRLSVRLLHGGRVPDRDRELLVLRVAFLCRSPYEWAQHLRISQEAGLTEAEIQRVRVGAEDPGWSELDAVLLRAADQLVATARLDDELWTALARHYDKQQMIELPVLVGFYVSIAYFLNSVRVELEPGVPPVPEETFTESSSSTVAT
jgi:alkylhydroperoxidase family enzyme